MGPLQLVAKTAQKAVTPYVIGHSGCHWHAETQLRDRHECLPGSCMDIAST